MKFVINRCHGGFNLSQKAINRIKELGYSNNINRIEGESDDNYEYRSIIIPLCCDRSNPYLLQVVEELGLSASGPCSRLRIAEIRLEDLYDQLIEEFDGFEEVKWPAIIIYEEDKED